MIFCNTSEQKIKISSIKENLIEPTVKSNLELEEQANNEVNPQNQANEVIELPKEENNSPLKI